MDEIVANIAMHDKIIIKIIKKVETRQKKR
jgi:hypothetical protein